MLSVGDEGSKKMTTLPDVCFVVWTAARLHAASSSLTQQVAEQIDCAAAPTRAEEDERSA